MSSSSPSLLNVTMLYIRCVMYICAVSVKRCLAIFCDKSILFRLFNFSYTKLSFFPQCCSSLSPCLRATMQHPPSTATLVCENHILNLPGISHFIQHSAKFLTGPFIHRHSMDTHLTQRKLVKHNIEEVTYISSFVGWVMLFCST